MLGLIAAVARNRVIGRDGGLPWSLPIDMRHFMNTTKGHTVIMGRRTYEERYEPLKDRVNIVVTSRTDYEAPGCTIARSLEEALKIASDDPEVFVIGGSGMFARVRAGCG